MNTKDKLVVLITVVAIIGGTVTLGIMNVLKHQSEEAQLQDHKHIRFFILQGGQNVTVPALIGIDSQYWKDHSLDSYGIGGNSPIHTHFLDNVIHIEANQKGNWTLGNFLDIWGYQLPEGSLVFSDFAGQPHIESNIIDYRNHVLIDKETITVHLPEFYGPVQGGSQ